MTEQGRSGQQQGGSAGVESADASMAWSGHFAGGIMADIRRRRPHYVDDFRQGLHSKVLASTLFLFFACLANAIAFGGLTGVVTGGEIGTVEMIVATAVGGICFALFSGQPLTILGGTGPIVIFTGLLYASCQQLGLPFLPVYAWVGIWSGLLLVALALFDASALMRYFTRFTDEIFAVLIAVIFIVEAFLTGHPDYAQALFGLCLGLGTLTLARFLSALRRGRFLNHTTRAFISDFGPAIAIAIMTLIAVEIPDVAHEGPAVPTKFATTTGRDWLVNLTDVPVWVIFASLVPALMATILLFLDQNITTRLVNSSDNKLRKGAGFHLDLLVVGLLVGFGSLFGLPWIVAATVHALNHVKSLSNTKVVDEHGNKREVITSVRENRISPLMIHVLIACSIFILPLITLIPMAVLFGLFLYMGITTLGGNQFWDRLTLWATDPKLYPDSHYVARVPRTVLHAFTAIQLVALAALWVLKASVLGLLFPVLIALLVPFRLYLRRHFDAEHLALLDAEGDVVETRDRAMAGDVHA
jgi:hypothetical protein